MHPHLSRLLAGLAALVVFAGPAGAQEGFSLKGSLIFNRSTAEQLEHDRERLRDAAGFNVGAELVLPLGVGLGVAAYQAGNVRDFDLSEGSLNFLAEANYFMRLPLLPLAPYAGLHVGLGSYRLRDLSPHDPPRPEIDFGDLGYQLGLRFQPSARFGLDAQYRRVSGSLAGAQDSRFETRQVLLGVTLF
jgi:hypothetical protein